MSGAYDEYLEMSDKGLSSVPDKQVCAGHIDEKFIGGFIRRNGERGTCDYCGRETTVLHLEEVMSYIMDAVSSWYTDPANFMGYNSREGGYQGTVYDGWEIINEVFELDIDPTALFNDMEASIDYSKAWADENHYYDDEADILSYQWDYFKNVVKHRSRYLFGNTSTLFSDDYSVKPFDILRDIGRKVNKFGLVRSLPAGTLIHRCRQHPRAEQISSAEQICSPKKEYAVNPNRMSPAGISMFYGAFDPVTCHLETLDKTDKKKRFYTTAAFATRRDLNVIDLTRLPAIPSPFDEKRRKDYYAIVFLRSFVADLSKAIARDSHVHIEYVPTQIITEYFRYTYSDRRSAGRKIDGIIYPSSRHHGKPACVLFMDHKESLAELEFNPEFLERAKIKKTSPPKDFDEFMAAL